MTLRLTVLKESILPDDVWQAYYAVFCWRNFSDYSRQELVSSWEAVYGEHPILSVLKRSRQGHFNWPQGGSGYSYIMPPHGAAATLEFNAVCFVVKESGIKSPVQIAALLKEAGYTQQQVFEGLLSVQQYSETSSHISYIRDLQLVVPQTDQRLSVMLMEVLKEVYGMSSNDINDINDIITIVKATDFKQEYGYIYGKMFVHNRPRFVAAAARDVFPEFSRGEILLVLKEVGYTLDEIYEDILKEPGHPVDTSIVNIFKDLGLSTLQAVTHLVNCDYPQFGDAEMSQVISMMDEQGYLAGDYVPYLAGRFPIPSVVRALNNNGYDLADIVEIIYPLYLEKGEKRNHLLAVDLIRGDIGLEDVLLALLNIGMPQNTVIDLLYHLSYVYGAITSPAIEFGKIAYNVGKKLGSIPTMEQIARAFIPIRLNPYDKFMAVFYATEAFCKDYADKDLEFKAMITGLGNHRVRRFITASSMESAGYSSSFMMSRLKNDAKVGWREATIIMLVAGYRTDYVIEQLWVQYYDSLIWEVLLIVTLKVTVARMIFDWYPYIPHVKNLVRFAKYVL